MLFYVRYKNGLRDDVQLVVGRWKKSTKDGQEAEFVPHPNAVGTAQGIISDDEVALQYSFPNLTNTKTNYNVAIRRSTLRFLETYQWDNPPEKPKKNKDADESQNSQPTKGTEDTAGHCGVFIPSAKP
jgi:hypothetical protein